MNTKEKLNVLNELLVSKGKKPLKGWSKSVKLLDERLATEGFTANTGAATPKPKAKVAPVRKVTIASVCRRMIADGAETDAIHQELLKVVDKYDESKKWYITWYRSDIKRKAAAA